MPAENTDVQGTETLLNKINGWCQQHLTVILLVLVLGWAGIRVAYFASMVKSPLYSLYTMEETDNKFFDDWARHLTTDWLNETPTHPFHQWHKVYADVYLQKHPDKLKELAAANGADRSSVEQALWNEWYNGNQYHQEPLYPYVLAVFYSMNIDAVKTMILLQLLLGVLSGVLLFSITRKHFGAATAVLTGIFYFLCGILMYNEVILLRTTWSVFFTILCVYVLDKAIADRKLRSFFLAGLCIGLAFLMQSTFALFIAGTLIIAFVTRNGDMSGYLKRAGCLLLGFMIMFAPVMLRNKIVGAPLTSISSVGPVTFIAANGYETKAIAGWSINPERDAELLAETHASLGAAMGATLKTHPSVMSYCLLEWEKLKAAWTGYEYPNNENYYFYKQYIPALKIAGLNFFWIAPLGLAGLILCIYQRRKHPALYFAIAVQVLTLLAFYVLGRFRAPLVILFLPLAAYAVMECLDFSEKTKKATFAKAGLVVALLVLSLTGYSAAKKDEMLTAVFYNAVFQTHFQEQLNRLAASKQWDEWLKLQQEFIEMAPNFIKNTELSDDEGNMNHEQITLLYMYQHKQRNKLYTAMGDAEGMAREHAIIEKLSAFASRAQSETKAPSNATDAENSFNKANEYVRQKKYPEAISILTNVVQKEPGSSKAHSSLGYAYYCNNQLDSAEAHLATALSQDSTNSGAMNGLALIYFNKKDYEKSISFCKQVISTQAQSNNPSLYINIGSCYTNLQKHDSAIAYVRKAVSISPGARTYDALARTYNAAGKTDSAKKYEQLAKEGAGNP